MYRLLVGIDVSKDFFSAAGLDREGEELFSGSYEMNSHGFLEFLRIISSHGEGLDQVIVAMESTGCYHIFFISALFISSIFAFINPRDINFYSWHLVCEDDLTQENNVSCSLINRDISKSP